MQEDKVVEIDGISYRFSFLKPSKALPLSVNLIKVVLAPAGELLQGIVSGTQGAKSLLDADLSHLKVGDICDKLAANLSPTQVLEMANELLPTVSYEPGPTAQEKGRTALKLDEDFIGNTKHLLKVLLKAVEVNFADFFDDLSAVARRGQSLLAKLASPPPSTGPSGG